MESDARLDLEAALARAEQPVRIIPRADVIGRVVLTTR